MDGGRVGVVIDNSHNAYAKQRRRCGKCEKIKVLCKMYKKYRQPLFTGHSLRIAAPSSPIPECAKCYMGWR